MEYALQSPSPNFSDVSEKLLNLAYPSIPSHIYYTLSQQVQVWTTPIKRWFNVKKLNQHCFNAVCPQGLALCRLIHWIKIVDIFSFTQIRIVLSEKLNVKKICLLLLIVNRLKFRFNLKFYLWSLICGASLKCLHKDSLHRFLVDNLINWLLIVYSNLSSCKVVCKENKTTASPEAQRPLSFVTHDKREYNGTRNC